MERRTDQITMRPARFMLYVVMLVLILTQNVFATSERVVKSQSFHWPRETKSVAHSTNGKLLAVYDSSGCYVSDNRGKHPRKIRMQIDQEPETEVEFSFNKAGTLLAVMAGGWYGEPHVHSVEQLWSVETASGRARKVGEYSDSLLGSGRVIEVAQRLGPWSRDGKSVQVIASVWEVVDGVADAHKTGEKRFAVLMTTQNSKTGTRSNPKRG